MGGKVKRSGGLKIKKWGGGANGIEICGEKRREWLRQFERGEGYAAVLLEEKKSPGRKGTSAKRGINGSFRKRLVRQTVRIGRSPRRFLLIGGGGGASILG